MDRTEWIGGWGAPVTLALGLLALFPAVGAMDAGRSGGAGAPGGPGALAAQGLELIPQAGVFHQLNSLGHVEGPDGAVELGRRESTLALGIGAELGARGPVSLRGTVLFGTSSDIPVSGAACADCSAPSTLLVAGGALLFRPFPTVLLARPYLLGGAAVKKLGFDDRDLRSSGFRRVVSESSRQAVQVGVGLEIGLGLIDAVVEVSDYVSRFEPSSGRGGLQNDVFVMVGLRL